MGSLISTIISDMAGRRVQPVIYATVFVGIALIIKEIVQEVLIHVFDHKAHQTTKWSALPSHINHEPSQSSPSLVPLSTESIQSTQIEYKPEEFEDLKSISLENLSRDLHNYQHLSEKLRRIQIDDRNHLLTFILLVLPYLILSQASFFIIPTPPAILNSVVGCIFICSYFIIRFVNLFVQVFVSKNASRFGFMIATYVHNLLFAFYIVIVIFVWDYLKFSSSASLL